MARNKLADSIDPSLERKRAKATAKLNAANTFETLTQEYIEIKMVAEGRTESTVKKPVGF